MCGPILFGLLALGGCVGLYMAPSPYASPWDLPGFIICILLLFLGYHLLRFVNALTRGILFGTLVSGFLWFLFIAGLKEGFELSGFLLVLIVTLIIFSLLVDYAREDLEKLRIEAAWRRLKKEKRK